ncbi:MAG: pilus assembly protein [Actinobacteria bacterium]|nr:pilus assembly protein [Actinomycetota bacterium]
MLIAFLTVLIDAGRLTWANARLESAAQDAARAVSINHNTTMSAHDAAVAAVRSILSSAGVSCAGEPRLTLVPDPANQAIRPGDPVTATVSCRVQLVILGSRQLTRSVVSRVDLYRQAPVSVGGVAG